jgi:hypothetical protein
LGSGRSRAWVGSVKAMDVRGWSRPERAEACPKAGEF